MSKGGIFFLIPREFIDILQAHIILIQQGSDICVMW